MYTYTHTHRTATRLIKLVFESEEKFKKKSLQKDYGQNENRKVIN